MDRITLPGKGQPQKQSNVKPSTSSTNQSQRKQSNVQSSASTSSTNQSQNYNQQKPEQTKPWRGQSSRAPGHIIRPPKDQTPPSFFSSFFDFSSKPKSKSKSKKHDQPSIPKPPPINQYDYSSDYNDQQNLSPVFPSNIKNRKQSSSKQSNYSTGWRNETSPPPPPPPPSSQQKQSHISRQSLYNIDPPHIDYSTHFSIPDIESIPTSIQKTLHHQPSNTTGTIYEPNDNSLNAIINRDNNNYNIMNQAIKSNETHHRFDNEERDKQREYQLKRETIKKLDKKDLSLLVSREQGFKHQQKRNADRQQQQPVARQVHNPIQMNANTRDIRQIANNYVGIDLDNRQLYSVSVSNVFNEQLPLSNYRHSVLVTGVLDKHRIKDKYVVKFYNNSPDATFKLKKGWYVMTESSPKYSDVLLLRFFNDPSKDNRSCCDTISSWLHC